MARHELPGNDDIEHQNPLTEDYRTKLEEAEEQKKKYIRRLQADMRKFIATDYGRRIFRRMYQICRANVPSAGQNSNGDLCPYKTFMNDGRKAVWLEMAAMMHPEDLKAVFATNGYSESEDTDDE